MNNIRSKMFCVFVCNCFAPEFVSEIFAEVYRDGPSIRPPERRCQLVKDVGSLEPKSTCFFYFI